MQSATAPAGPVERKSRNECLEAALAFANRGWPVIPLYQPASGGGCTCPRGKACDAPGKHPRIKGWKEKASTDPEVIKKWWAQWPQSNVGIVTGEASGLLVLDVDVSGNGEENLRELEGKYGPLPETVEALTGSGGRHIFFKCPKERKIPNKARFYEGLDTRSTGGLIVAPSSIHVSGRTYEWEIEHHPADTPLADAPEWLLDLMEGKQPGGKAGGKQAGRAKKVEGPIPKGARNQTLTSLAGTMRYRGMGREAILAALVATNESRCVPPLSYEEVVAITDSVSKYEPGEPQSKKTFTLPYTDAGNGELFAREHGDTTRYCHLLKKWFIWGNTHWKVDNSKAVEQMAKKSIMRLYNAAAEMDSKSQGFDLLLKHIKKSLSNTGLKAMVERAQSEQGIPVDPSDFNKDKMLFNTLNCTIDLRTGETRPHSKEDMINKISPVVYDPDAQAPTWHKFLDQIMAGDKELISFLQRWVGYTLSGETSEQCFVFLYGRGGNGKSRFVMPIQAIMGDYARTITTEALMVRRNGGEAPSPYIARLHGARMVVASETNEGVRLSESLIKQLSGEDVIIARHLHAEPVEFVPEFKLWIYGNHKPKVVGQDEGIWRRVLLIPFEVTIPKEKRDKDLLKKLYAELPGILVWAVRGCLEWQRIGLSPPKKVLLATEEYRKENNLVENFIAECCILKDYAKTRSGDLYDAFKKWCAANGETPYSQTKFGTLLSNEGLQGVRGTGGRKWWEGIGLIDEKISVGGAPPHDGAGVGEGAKGRFASVPVVSVGLEDYEKAW